MLQNTSFKPYSRFAWLTPLAGKNNANGPWLLTDNDTLRLEQEPSISTIKVSIKAYLDLLMGVLDVDSPLTSTKKEDLWRSDCQRYAIRWHKQAGDTSRLFIQHRSDYFARVELFMDDNLLVAYQEPVWPHLQRSLPTQIEHLPMPMDCLQALQKGTKCGSADQLPESSANEAINTGSADSRAA